MYKCCVFLVLLFTLNGCLLLSDPIDNTKETLTEQAQNTIVDYNSKTIKKTYSYDTYYFSKLKQHNPKEIQELEQLFDERDELPSKRRDYSRDEYKIKSEELDSLIDVKRYKIKRKNLHSEYSMEHIFILTEPATETKKKKETIMEARYYLNHTLDSVKRVKVLMNVEVPLALQGVFDSFFFEDPLHRTDDYNADRDSDESFYVFFKERLASFENVNEKSDFLLHALFITKLTSRNKKYIPEQFGLLLANQFVKENYGDSYQETLRTSQMYALFDSEDDSELLGYELFLEASFNESPKKRCFYFNFNPWLEIVKFELISPPYEEYFK